MKTQAIVLSLLALAAGASLPAQESKPRSAPKAPKASESAQARIDRLIEQLGDSDYKTRKAAEESLLREGEQARKALDHAAKHHDDPEVRWRAGRTVRLLDAPKRGALARRRDRSGEDAKDDAPRPSRPGIDRTIEDAMREFERAFDHRSFDRIRGEVDRAMARLREQRDSAGARIGGSSSRSMTMRSGPDGVRVEITEKGKDGKPKTKVYEAEDMESFKRKFPKILDGAGLGDGLRIRLGEDFDRIPFVRSPFELRPPSLPRLQPPSLPRLSPPGVPATPTVGSGRKLGFFIGTISPAVRDYLDLDEGVGLMVETVQDGSAAARLGMRHGDILTKVGKRSIGSASDVAQALEGVGDHGSVSVQVLRKGRQLTLGPVPLVESTKDGASDDKPVRRRRLERIR
ncbi:MAG: PDZ domain-containing protein [Planctomycetes bacterium]|nr:PDZ domain-containing protein [Planctomycetota bacterium]